MPSTGYIQVRAYTSNAQYPLKNVAITVTSQDGTAIASRVEHKTIFHLAHPTSFLLERRIERDRSMDTITREARLKNNAALSISESIPCL